VRRISEEARPIGPGKPHWLTVQTTRIVLVVVHTMTAWNRLADILPVFDSDRRVQLVFTFPDVSNVTGDVERQLGESGGVIIPWARALSDTFDLAVSVHHSGDLHRISAPLAVLSHGIGYTKRSRTENREPRTENREPRTENREPRTENREPRTENVYGLGREWLVRNGSVPDAVVLAHDGDRRRLAESAPEALPSAVVAGDPCYDRMQASQGFRAAYRQALGVAPEATVVTVSSTWGPDSLLGRFPDLIDDLLSELTLDDHVVAAIAHPNVWFAHGPLQLRMWLADALRSGLRLIPPVSGWQQTIIASDIVVGDHGSVTGYAAANGIATLLAAYPRHEVASGSAIDLLGDLAPRVHPAQPLSEQIARAMADHDGERLRSVAALATSRPGESADALRSAFYRLLKLSPPEHSPPVFPYTAADLQPHRAALQACWVAREWHGEHTVSVRRWPADVTARRLRGHRTADACLVAHLEHPRYDLRSNADVIVLPDQSAGVPDEIFARTLEQQPGCAAVAAPTGKGRLRMRIRGGTMLEASFPDRIPGPMPAAIAAAVLSDRFTANHPPMTLTILLGEQRIPVHVNEIAYPTS